MHFSKKGTTRKAVSFRTRRRGGDVVGPLPEMHLVGAPALARLFLVDADELAVVALVERGILQRGNSLADLLENDVQGVVARFSVEVKAAPKR